MASSSPDPKQKLMLAGLLAAVGGVIWFQFLLIPQLGSAGKLGAQLKNEQSQLQKVKRELLQLPDLEKKRDLLAAQYPAPEAGMPPEQQLPDLMEKIAQAARAARVRITVLRPKQDFAQAVVGPSGYLEIPLELGGLAGYHQIGRFLDELERSGRLLLVKELEIRPSGTDIWNHQLRMTLTAFLVPGSENQ